MKLNIWDRPKKEEQKAIQLKEDMKEENDNMKKFEQEEMQSIYHNLTHKHYLHNYFTFLFVVVQFLYSALIFLIQLSWAS